MENLNRVKQLARDLRREEPRPSSDELAGESHAARALDKCRAALVGWNGEFNFAVRWTNIFSLKRVSPCRTSKNLSPQVPLTKKSRIGYGTIRVLRTSVYQRRSVG